MNIDVSTNPTRVEVDIALIHPEPIGAGVISMQPTSRAVLARTVIWREDGSMYEMISGDGKRPEDYLFAVFGDEAAWREHSEWADRCERVGARAQERTP